MNIIMNGAPLTLSEDANVSTLLASMGTGPGLLVVELNGSIVDAISFPKTTIHEGDRVEVVRFVGGG